MSISKQPTRHKLENDQMCGITTGGSEDCIWDCEVAIGRNGPIITTPECLIDCFPAVSITVKSANVYIKK